MNHLGDTNKMVDTPRMDASAHDDGAIWQTGCDIERELNAANDEIERLRKSNLQLREGAEEQKHRIKRLEEAYSATEAVRTIRDCWCNHDPDTWTRCSTCCDKIKRYHAAKANLNRTEEAKEAKL
jgi:chromosome segregation ATPase